jgi:hypothetical protein
MPDEGRRHDRCSPGNRSGGSAAGLQRRGKWEAMHGNMGGYYEVRVTGPGRTHHRLFCRLDNGTEAELRKRGFDRPQIVAINGLAKPNAKLFTDAEYKKHVRDLGDDYLSKLPRPVAT